MRQKLSLEFREKLAFVPIGPWSINPLDLLRYLYSIGYRNIVLCVFLFLTVCGL